MRCVQAGLEVGVPWRHHRTLGGGNWNLPPPLHSHTPNSHPLHPSQLGPTHPCLPLGSLCAAATPHPWEEGPLTGNWDRVATSLLRLF